MQTNIHQMVLIIKILCILYKTYIDNTHVNDPHICLIFFKANNLGFYVKPGLL